MVATAVRIDNRLYERYLQRKETRQWRSQGQRPFGHNRRHEGRRGQQRQQPREYSDPYGPRPIELDAARLPTEEQKRRKDNNLYFNCGKPGHRARECKSRHNNAKPQQLRATQSNKVRPQQLRATQEQDKATLEGLLARWTTLSPEQIQPANEGRARTRISPGFYERRAKAEAKKGNSEGTFTNENRGLNSAEHATEEFPDIDWENIESQGWTQYGP